MFYLDNAATTFPKPARVCDEMCRCMRGYCGNPGRGAHPIAMAAAGKVFECRERLASFFGAPGADHVIMTPNATVAAVLEFGRSDRSARPFVRPAVAECENEVVEKMQEVFNREASR